MNYNKAVIPFISLLIIVSGLITVRINILNKTFPNPSIHEHYINEKIDGGEISLTALDSNLAHNSHIKKLFPDYIDYTMNSDGTNVTDEQVRVLLVHVKLTNNTEFDKEMSLVQFTAESCAWANGIDGSLFSLFNKENNNPMGVVVPANSEIELFLPYSMYDFQFNRSEWKYIDNRKFDLVLSNYPVKNIIILE